MMIDSPPPYEATEIDGKASLRANSLRTAPTPPAKPVPSSLPPYLHALSLHPRFASPSMPSATDCPCDRCRVMARFASAPVLRHTLGCKYRAALRKDLRCVRAANRGKLWKVDRKQRQADGRWALLADRIAKWDTFVQLGSRCCGCVRASSNLGPSLKPASSRRC
jgi:hypothetical protein